MNYNSRADVHFFFKNKIKDIRNIDVITKTRKRALNTNKIKHINQGIKNNTVRRYFIMKYVCDICGWEYDEEQGYPEGGIAPGTKFEDLPDDFACPLCGVGKDMFSEA